MQMITRDNVESTATGGKLIVRVISMANATSRREAMQAQLKNLKSHDWSFFDALESLPENLLHLPQKAFSILRRSLTKGEIGCFASHISVWRWFSTQDDYATLVVLEDDVLLDLAFFENLRPFLNSLPQISYLRLYAKVPVAMKRIDFIMGKHIVRHKGTTFGTQGYILSKSGARNFLHKIRTVTRPIDDEMDRYWIHKIPNIGVFPFPIIELSVPSTIGDQRRKPVSTKPYDYMIWKLHRLYNSVCRRFANGYYAVSEIRTR